MKSALFCTAALGVALAATSSVEAGGCRYGTGYGNSYNLNNGYSNRYSWRAPSYYRTPAVSPYSSSSPRWHDTSHYDYHGPSLQRHGNHFHSVPGHYHFHRTGHWHY